MFVYKGRWSLSIRILIADDFKAWRLQVLALLQARAAWQVIAEASDGSEAVQKAEELKPDLILLDIGLPKLNGIEAARQIRQLSPNSKIIFLSMNSDLDIVRAALGTGAFGYVRKTDARRELLSGMDAVLRGEQFVSRNLKGYGFTDTSAEKAAHRHEVQFYSDDSRTSGLEGYSDEASKGVKEKCFVVITESRSDGLVSICLTRLDFSQL